MIKLDKCAMHYICGDNVCFIPNLEERVSQYNLHSTLVSLFCKGNRSYKYYYLLLQVYHIMQINDNVHGP